MKALRQLGKYALVFLLTYLILAASLVAVATIPREAIKPKMRESAEYLCERTTSFRVIDSRRSSHIDRFADCILLSIAYHLDERQPLVSSMWAKYYGGYSNRANEYLLEGIDGDGVADNQYLRYWHGSVVPVRLMHLFWNIRAIYIFHAALMAALLFALLALLWRHGLKGEAAGLAIALAVVSIWFVPLCLEYTWTFLIMLAASIVAARMALRGKARSYGAFFLVVGMVTAFLDFLTTETLTLLIPLLLVLRIQARQGKDSNAWGLSAQACVLWLIGFAGMWAMKWATASVVLGENVMTYVSEHIRERISGPAAGLTTAEHIREAVLRNIRELPFYEYGIYGAAALFLLILGGVALPVWFKKLALRKEIDWSRVALVFLLGLVPYIRYLVLFNHSYRHAFTYRAQAASVLALCSIVMELVEIRRKPRNTPPMSPGGDRGA